MIFERKVDTVYISFKDRLTRLSFVTLQSIFDNFGTKIIVISKEDKKDSKGDLEMFEELIFLMHYFSTRMYSNRRRKKMNILKKDLGLEFLK